MHGNIDVLEMTKADIQPLVDYWMNSSPDFLVSLGVDLHKMPARAELELMLEKQLSQSYPEKMSYCLIWLVDGKPSGHCNINKIIFGKEAFMHLHLWKETDRKKGWGVKLVKKSLPYFFRNFKLDSLYCEPYSLNVAPNNTLRKAGFRFVKMYTTIPGSINFEQEVHRWEIKKNEINEVV